MKRLVLISMVFFIGSCYYNATISNEESEKKKGEQVADVFYQYVEDSNFDGSIKPYFSTEFLAATPVSQLDSLLSFIKGKSGSYEYKELKEWSTKRQKGTHELWECELSYSVKYEKGKSREYIKLIKENDSIKILNYNFTSNEGN